MPRNPTKKPRVLRKKNIMKRKSATSQAKQIATLSRQLGRMNKENFNNIRTSWQRNNLPIGSTSITGIATPYVCPIPYTLCDPLGVSPVPNAQLWADNRVIGSQPTFSKRLVFGHSDASTNSNKIYHTGGKLRYTVYTDEPSYTKLTIALIRPKKKQADQLSIDRNLKGASGLNQPGSSAEIYDDIDYTTHSGAGGLESTWYGAEINTKYWDVLYKREIGLQQPKNLAASAFVRSTPIVGNGKNTTLVATGSIRLPAGGEIKAVGNLTSQNQSPATAMEQQYLDQRNENSCYLVGIHNDLTLDTENVSMGFVVTDYYKAVV